MACFLLLLNTADAVAQQSEADVYVAEAILAFEDRRYDEALARLREALALEPTNVDALYYLGLVEIALGRLARAVEALEKAHALAPSELAIALQLGLAYFTQERYERAEPLLAQVFVARPQTDGIGYFVGFMRYRRRDYQGALEAFRAGASTDLSIQQLTRFYAGLALVALGLPERASAEIEEALRVAPASPLTIPAERLRESVRTAARRDQRFRAEVRVGALYDTNVAVRPPPSTDPTAERIRRGPSASPAELVAVRIDYVWLRLGAVDSTVGYSFFQTINNDLPDFNLQSHQALLGASRRGAVGALPFQIGAQYLYDYVTLGDDEFLQRHTAVLYGTLVESALHLTAAQARLQAKEFAGDAAIPRAEVRDASNVMLGLSHVLRFAADRHLLRVGYQLDSEDAHGRNFSYLGHRVQVGGQLTLPWAEVRIRYDYDVHVRSYRHAHSLLPEAAPRTRERRDTEQAHAVRVEKALRWNVSVSVDYQTITSRSNLPVFSFDRDIVSLMVSWQY